MNPDAIPPSSSAPSPPGGEEDMSDTAIVRMLEVGGGPRPKGPGWTPLAAAELQHLLPGFEVRSLLGCGGMGAVYRGVQKSLNRTVAIKILPPELAGSDLLFSTRFEQEARAMAALSHPHIVPVHDFGQAAEGLLYIVMEFVDGTTLAQILQSEGLLGLRRAAAIISQVCDALEFAHQNGIVHRDIKPSNVMVSKGGHVKLADFGLAHSLLPPDSAGPFDTRTCPVMGTRAYMAPEQALGRAVDHRADIYSVGAMFYEMLTGRPPQGPLEPPSSKRALDTRLDEVVLKALASDPERRYQHAGEIKSEVTRVTGQVALSDLGSGFGFKRPLLAVLALLLLGAVPWLWYGCQPGTSGSLSRRCAQAALLHGARVRVRDARGRESVVSPGGDLPPGMIRLLDIRFDSSAPAPSPLSAEDVLGMTGAPDLETLSFFQSQPHLSGAVFASIGALTRLRELNFSSPSLRDEWLRHLSGCATLERLRMPQAHITDAGLAHLASLPRLVELDVNDSKVSGRQIAALTSAGRLTLLRFGERGHWLAQEDLSAIAASCTNIENLVLGGSARPEHLEILARLPMLSVLVLNHQPLTAAHFHSLVSCPCIEEIDLMQCSITDEAWSAVARLPRLSRLRLHSMPWPQAAAQPLSAMANLHTLILEAVPETDRLRARTSLPKVIIKDHP